MKTVKFKGFSQLQLGLGIVVLLALIGAVVGVNLYLDARDAKNKEAGAAAERAKWQARESAELARAQATILFLNERYAAMAAAHAKEINALSGKYQEEMKDAKAQHERDVAAVRAGFRLRDPDRPAAAPCQDPGRSAPPGALAAASGPDAAGGGELSERATAFLLGQANRADAVVKKLHKVQALVLTYYKACGQKNGPTARGAPPGLGGDLQLVDGEDAPVLPVPASLDHDDVPDLALDLVMIGLHHGDGVPRLE